MANHRGADQTGEILSKAIITTAIGSRLRFNGYVLVVTQKNIEFTVPPRWRKGYEMVGMDWIRTRPTPSWRCHLIAHRTKSEAHGRQHLDDVTLLSDVGMDALVECVAMTTLEGQDG